MKNSALQIFKNKNSQGAFLTEPPWWFYAFL